LRLKPLQTLITMIDISLHRQSHYMLDSCTSSTKTLIQAASPYCITCAPARTIGRPTRLAVLSFIHHLGGKKGKGNGVSHHMLSECSSTP